MTSASPFAASARTKQCAPFPAAALVKAIKPTVAVPMHFGLVNVPAGGLGPGSAAVIVGVEADGPKFKTAASPG